MKFVAPEGQFKAYDVGGSLSHLVKKHLHSSVYFWNQIFDCSTAQHYIGKNVKYTTPINYEEINTEWKGMVLITSPGYFVDDLNPQ